MCFKIDYKNCPSELIAQSDITCYKVGFKVNDETFRSYYYNTIYKMNELKETNKLNPTYAYDSIFEIDKGFHSYINLKEAKLFFSRRMFTNIKNLCIGEFKIPVNSKYYLNKNEGTFISDKIIFAKFIDLL